MSARRPTLWGRRACPTFSLAQVRSHSHKVCALCDASFTSWGEHAAGVAHQAKSVIAATFARPERSAAIEEKLTRHLSFNFDEVDALTERREQQRRQRLCSVVAHLRDKEVVQHSLPELLHSHSERASTSLYVEDFVVDDRFSIFLLAGKSFALQELTDRTARLMPTCTNIDQLSSVVQYLLSSRHLAQLFDSLKLASLLLPSEDAQDGAMNPSADGPDDAPNSSTHSPTRAPQLRVHPDVKAIVVLSLVGELRHFSRQPRSHQVTDRVVADRLVLHVLASHTLETILAELLHGVLQRVISETMPVWSQHQQDVQVWERSVVTHLLPLADAREAKPMPSIDEQAQRELKALIPLCGRLTAKDADGGVVALVAPRSPRCAWSTTVQSMSGWKTRKRGQPATTKSA